MVYVVTKKRHTYIYPHWCKLTHVYTWDTYKRHIHEIPTKDIFQKNCEQDIHTRHTCKSRMQDLLAWDTHKTHTKQTRDTNMIYLQDFISHFHKIQYKRYIQEVQHDILTGFYFTLSQDTIQEIHTRGTTWHTDRILFHTFTRCTTRDTYKRYIQEVFTR